jgi:hypothetical protein
VQQISSITEDVVIVVDGNPGTAIFSVRPEDVDGPKRIPISLHNPHCKQPPCFVQSSCGPSLLNDRLNHVRGSRYGAPLDDEQRRSLFPNAEITDVIAPVPRWVKW